jgi:hypothetical protein
MPHRIGNKPFHSLMLLIGKMADWGSGLYHLNGASCHLETTKTTWNCSDLDLIALADRLVHHPLLAIHTKEGGHWIRIIEDMCNSTQQKLMRTL